MSETHVDNQNALQTVLEFLPCGISLFNSELELVMYNQKLRTLLDFPDSLFADGLPSLRTLFLFNAGRGEYGPGDPEALADQLIERARNMQPHVFERQRPGGIVLEVRGTPLPGGGFVTIYTDITDRKSAEQDAQRSSTYLDTVLNTLPQGVTVINEKLDIVLWNKRFENVMGMHAGDLAPGIPFEEVIRRNAERGEYGEVNPAQKAKDTVALAMKFEPHRLERTRPDGRTLEIEGRDMQIDGKVAGFVSTYTERIRNEQTLRRVKNLMSDAINFSPTFIWETDADGNYTYLQGIEHILGFAESDMIGLARFATLCGDGQCASCEIGRRIRAKLPIEGVVIQARNKAGEAVWLSSSARPVFDENGRYLAYRGVDVDVSEITRARQELEQMALHDALTGLANRRKFQDRYELERLRQARVGLPLSLILVDVDHFKAVNDSWGHEHESLLVGEKLRRAVETAAIDTGLAAQPTLQVTASFGVATLFPHEAVSLEALIERADAAVYAAKDGGRNRVCTADAEAGADA